MAIFRSMDQLRNQVWDSREEAVKELKRNSFKPEGPDYLLAQTEAGKWYIADRTDDVSQAPPEERKAPAKKMAANSAPKKAAAKKAPAKKTAPEPEPEPTTPEPEPEPPAGGDMSIFAAEAGPYDVRIAAEHVRQTSVNHHALEISEKVRVPVAVYDKAGEWVRTIDAKVVAQQKKQRGGKRKAPGGGRKSGQMSDLATQAMTMAKRKEGARRSDLNKINDGIGWRSYLARYGEREGLELSQTKDDNGITYFLKPKKK